MKWLGKGSLGVAPGDKDDVAIELSHSETLQTSSTFEHIAFAFARVSLKQGNECLKLNPQEEGMFNVER